MDKAAEKRPSAALSSPLTLLAAWQKVAPYSSQRRPLILFRVKHGAGLLRRPASSTRRMSVFEP
jgi:hypothetical protein